MKFYINSNEREKYNFIYLFARERIIWRRRLESQVVRVSQPLPPQKSFVLETQENDGYFFLSSHIAFSYLCHSHCTPTKGTILLLTAFLSIESCHYRPSFHTFLRNLLLGREKVRRDFYMLPQLESFMHIKVITYAVLADNHCYNLLQDLKGSYTSRSLTSLFSNFITSYVSESFGSSLSRIFERSLTLTYIAYDYFSITSKQIKYLDQKRSMEALHTCVPSR